MPPSTTATLHRPPALQPGDTIAFIAPASGLASIVPHRVERAAQELESYGFKVKVYPSVMRTPQQNLQLLLQDESIDQETRDASASPLEFYSSADPQTRAQELMDAFRDPQVKAILCTIGGFTSHELLEYLDFDVIRANPKIFSGYSNITTLHLALYTQTQLCTFYGPSAV